MNKNHILVIEIIFRLILFKTDLTLIRYLQPIQVLRNLNVSNMLHYLNILSSASKPLRYFLSTKTILEAVLSLN